MSVGFIDQRGSAAVGLFERLEALRRVSAHQTCSLLKREVLILLSRPVTLL